MCDACDGKTPDPIRCLASALQQALDAGIKQALRDAGVRPVVLQVDGKEIMRRIRGDR